MQKKPVRRRWYLDSQGTRRLGSRETGFHYVSADGQPITDERTLARIQKLRIPPAWREVRIARGEGAPLQAVGLDKRGRTQYLYHSRFRAQQEEAKFLHVVEFGESLSRLRRRVHRDLALDDLSKDNVLAAVVRLMDQGFFRPGNDKSATDDETYGLTTVLSSHVSVSGAKLTFDFVGKWRKHHRRVIEDAEVARVVRRLKAQGGGELFKFVSGKKLVDVKDRHVNQYIQSIIGSEFTAKDFRTWAGTLLCSVSLGVLGQAETKRGRRKNMKHAIEATSMMLGNTPAVCRKSYICPRLLEEYESGKPFIPARKKSRPRPVARLGLSLEEKTLLKFLRETIADRRRAPRAA